MNGCSRLGEHFWQGIDFYAFTSLNTKQDVISNSRQTTKCKNTLEDNVYNLASQAEDHANACGGIDVCMINTHFHVSNDTVAISNAPKVGQARQTRA